MEDMRKFQKRMAIKDHATGPWSDGNKRSAMNEHGGVGFVCACGHYDMEMDKWGNCRDEDCRRFRFMVALHKGEAMMLKNGDIIWTPGVKIRKG